MRKIAICALGFAVALMGLYCSTSYAAANEKQVTIVDLKGNVEVMQAGSSSWVRAENFMKLGTGDTVKTEGDSYADLKFNGLGEAALVRVEANSSMKIDAYVSSRFMQNRKITLDLAMGDILVKANKLKEESQFQVRTPTSIVGVRGTGFKVHVSSEK